MIGIPWETIRDAYQKHEDLEIYQPRDAQAYMKISADTLNEWRATGWLKAIARSGRGYLYLKEDLDQALRLRNKDRENLEVVHG